MVVTGKDLNLSILIFIPSPDLLCFRNAWAHNLRTFAYCNFTSREQGGFVPLQQELMDVKTVSFCPTRYPATILDTRHAAVSRRASAVHREMHAKARKVDRRWNGTAHGAQGPVERRMQEFGPIGGLVVGAFGEASADVLTLIQRTALFNAERNGLWRCMGASSLEDGAKVLEKRAIRTLGVEGVRGLARARLANLSHVCSNYRQSGPNRGREKAYYENARQAHYERFGPRAYYKSGRRQHSS